MRPSKTMGAYIVASVALSISVIGVVLSLLAYLKLSERHDGNKKSPLETSVPATHFQTTLKTTVEESKPTADFRTSTVTGGIRTEITHSSSPKPTYAASTTEAGSATTRTTTRTTTSAPSPLSKGWKDAAVEIKGKIDFSTKPCDDFYTFACGSWMRNNGSDGSVFETLSRQVFGNVTKAIKKIDVREGDVTSAMAKVKAIFKACREIDLPKNVIKPHVEQLFRRSGGWPMAMEQWKGSASVGLASSMMGVMVHDFGLTAALNPFTDIDIGDVSRNALYFAAPAPLFSTYWYNLKGFKDDLTRMIVKSAKFVASLTNQHVNDDELEAEADRVVDLDYELAKLSKTEAEVPLEQLYNKYSFSQLAAEWNNVAFDEYLNALIPSVEQQKHKDFSFVVAYPTQYRDVNRWFEDKIGTVTMINYLCFIIAGNYLALASDPAPFEETTSSACTETTTAIMPDAISRLYVSDSPKEKLEKEKSLIGEEISAFDGHLDDVKWMDEQSKAEAIRKADNIQRNIGYPLWIMDDAKLNAFYEGLTVTNADDMFNCTLKAAAFAADQSFGKLVRKPDRGDFLSTVAVVNAWYAPEYNSITIPAGIANSPFFRSDFPAAVNFGALGVVVGHELTHGYDNMGMNFNYNGTLQRWMTDRSKAAFDEMSDCVVQQYSKTCYPDLDMCIDGKKTLGENIADNGGIKVAFYAYQRFIKERGEEPRLPGLSDFSMEQIFFLSFAQVWCEVASPFEVMIQILIDVHSPAMARVMNTLRNFEEFRKAFNCRPGMTMSPVKHCDVW